MKYSQNYSCWKIELAEIEEIHYDSIGTKTSRTEYVYDPYGNVITEKRHGDTSTTADDVTVWRTYYPNTTANILSKPARERVYQTIMASDDGGVNLKAETLYYYDSNNTSLTTPPVKGNLTRTEQKKDASTSVSSYFTYDPYGNVLTSQDANGNMTTLTYDSSNTYVATKLVPLLGTETYTYEWNWMQGTDTGVMKVTVVDFNGDVIDNVTTTYYDKFNRIWKVVKPGDDYASPSVVYEYNNWGTANQQHVKTITKIVSNDTIWQSQYFDGLGRVIQVHSPGEGTTTIISGTTTYNNRGMVDKQYVAQEASTALTAYQTPEASWKYASSTYDALGRIISQTAADGATINHDYSVTWRDAVTNANGHVTRYYYDAFQRLVKVEEMSTPSTIYATTIYAYDTLGNLTQVTDAAGNVTSMSYDWLGRKTAMTDPDMGSWSYGYDNNGNLTSQTDAKGQTITMAYDALNRLTGKNYPTGSGMTNVAYTYDQGTNGKGQRTSMTDASGSTDYTYDARGRLLSETRIIDSVTYPTSYTYDGLDRAVTITYPSGETVTQTYDNRGLPFTLAGNEAGNIVTSTYYNSLGLMTEINLGNGAWTTYGYYDGSAGTPFGRLHDITTTTSVLFYDLTVSSTTGGSVTTPGESTFEDYTEGTIVNLVATPDTGYAFVNWTGDTTYIADVNSATTTITMNGDYSITANFALINYYDLTVSSSTGGSVTTPGEGVYQDYTEGAIVNLVASPDTGYKFVNWTSDTSYIADVNSATTTITMNGDYSITANFALINYYDLTVSSSSGGSVTAPGEGTFEDYTEGTIVNLVAAPDSGYEFVNWTGDTTYIADVNSATTTITMNGDYSITANFALINYYDLTVSSSSGGSVTAPGEGTFEDYTEGIIVNLVAAPDSGYEFVNWTGDTTYVADVNSATTTITMNDDYSITANFQQIIGSFLVFKQFGPDDVGWSNPLYSAGQHTGGTIIQHIEYVWDAGGNLTNRQDFMAGTMEIFTYDFLDRLLTSTTNSVLTETYAYTTIGNIYSRNGTLYAYDNTAHKHAVTSVGSRAYTYDANGNMLTRGTDTSDQTLAWDVENRPSTVSEDSTVIASFVYDGDGNRVKKTEDGNTIIYVNQYYEVNVTTATATSNYYLGGKLIAIKEGDDLRYVHADHLGSTSLMTDEAGLPIDAMTYKPYGETLSGEVPTDIKFTGQRLDSSGLYFYNARYYDAFLGRFISPDSVNPDLFNPQSLNKYSYCFDNPLKYNDPTGNWPNWANIGNAIKSGFQASVNAVKQNIDVIQTVLDVAGMIPVVGEAFDAVNGIIYAARGDYVNAGLSLAACIPVFGTAATGAKIAVRTIDQVADIAQITKHADKTEDALSILALGEKNTHVYVGIKDGQATYAGISNQMPIREAHHGARFDYLQQITKDPVTRNQARAVEQVLIEANPQFTNIINSISPNNNWYNEAIAWGQKWFSQY